MSEEIKEIDKILTEIRETLNMIANQLTKPDEKKIEAIWEKIQKIETMLEQKPVEKRKKREIRKKIEQAKDRILSYFDFDEGENGDE